MGLYHFFWKGEERSVAMNRHDHNRIAFYFVDKEILEKVSSRILLRPFLAEGRYINTNEIASVQEADNLLLSIEQSIGQTFLKNCFNTTDGGLKRG